MMNNVQLIGRLVSAPELSTTKTDKNFTRVTLAVNRRFKNADGDREADFISCMFWGKTAETIVSYAKKGMLISVEGEIRAYSFDGKDKERHYVTEVLGVNFQMLESRTTVARRAALAVQGTKDADMILEAEELPF
ncbi:MAG: single-stranded DNA-binding protein [Streptococcaceae bacterium]|nr:single-stranded DNA-binding protein [Streptococcaceae bacterium]